MQKSVAMNKLLINDLKPFCKQQWNVQTKPQKCKYIKKHTEKNFECIIK